MKKVIMFITCMLISINIVSANKIEVKLDKCIDGDTARFIYNNKSIKTRFLAINTPEIDSNEKYSYEAKEYSCNKLKQANKIVLEYDPNSDKTDKYDRHLVWVWIDNKLLQKDIVNKGYAKVDYLYNEYKYTNILLDEENKAKNNNLGIWSNTKTDKTNNNNTEDNKNYIIPIIISIITTIIILITKRNSK